MIDKKVGRNEKKAETYKAVSSSDKFLSKIFISLIFIFLLTPFYSAQIEQQFSTDPQLRYYTSDGYVIHPIFISKGQLDKDVYLNFRVYDDSGKVIYVNNANVNCSAFMFSPLGKRIYRFDGNEELDNISDTGRLAMFPASFFTEQGYYKWYVSCQNANTNLGGAVEGELLVTPSGNSGSQNTVFFVFLIVMFYSITFISFYGKNIPMTVLGGMAMMFLGVYLVNEGIIIYRDVLTNYFAYVTIGLGVIMSFWALLEEFDMI